MYDWEHGRRLVAFTTGDPDSVRNAVERHIPEGGSLRVEPVERSLDALTRTRDKVTDDWKELENEGISVIAASVDAQCQLEQYQGITIEPCTNSACS